MIFKRRNIKVIAGLITLILIITITITIYNSETKNIDSLFYKEGLLWIDISY